MQLKSDLVGRIAAEARKRLGADKSAVVEAFIAQYYANVSPRDLRDADAEDLFGAVLAHWKLAAKRAPRTALVRVYNPTLEEHGWRCDHTVVEIVNDDMPFLVDSVTAELNRQGLTVHLIVHPIVAVKRDDAGKLIEIVQPGKADKGVAAESFMHIQVSEQPDDKLADSTAGLAHVLGEVRAAVEDWRTMRERMAAVIADLSGAKTKDETQAEVTAFLNWIHDNQFTFLGYREYELKGSGDKTTFAVKPDSGLGILRDPNAVVFEVYRNLAAMPPDRPRIRSQASMNGLIRSFPPTRISNADSSRAMLAAARSAAHRRIPSSMARYQSVVEPASGESHDWTATSSSGLASCQNTYSIEITTTLGERSKAAAIAAAPGRSRIGSRGSVNRPCGVRPKIVSGDRARR